MTEPDDALLGAEFAAYRETLVPAIHPAGPAAARATVRRRRRRTAVATAAAVVIAVAVPVAGQAAFRERTAPPPGPAQTAEPTPSATPSPTPSSPSPTPSTASATPAAPDGRISRAQLLAARLDLAAWPSYVPASCTTENVRLRSGPIWDYLPSLLDLAHGDVDADGATETVALLGCRIGEAQAKQLVAFDRDDDGRIVTLGRIVRTQDGLDDITDFAVADGHVRAQVADLQPCCSTPAYWARHQWRTYGWTGERFTQTDGPTAWGPDTRLTDLALTAAPLVLGPADATGTRPGSLTLTVTNKGPLDVAQLGFAELETIGRPDGGDWSLCRKPSGAESPSCLVPGLRVGERRTYTFRFLVDPPTRGPTGRTSAAGARVVHHDAENRYWKDVTPKDNSVTVRIED